MDLEVKEKQKKLNELSCELDLCEKKLEESQENSRIKVEALEDILAHLQNGITKLENSGNSENVLKEQVQRLEQQLIELHENSALLKQELSQLKTKHWRMEKELENAEIDKRILQRECKDFEKQIKLLNEQIDHLKKENEAKNALLAEIDRLKKRVTALENECVAMDSLKSELHEKQTKIQQLLNDLTTAKTERTALEHKLNLLQNENHDLRGILDDLKREKVDQINLLETKEQELQNTRLNLNALRDACVILENQLVEYERLHDTMCERQATANAKTEMWLENLTKAQEQVKEARKAANEEKSLRLLCETKYKRVSDELDLVQKEQEQTKLRCKELKEHSNDLMNQLNALQEKLADFEVTVNAKERTIKDLCIENKCLKETNSEKLTTLQNYKETNYDLKHKLEEYEELSKQLMEQITELEQILNEKTNHFREREMKTDATIQQQTKLINYLQTKLEDYTNKKKSFAERLFSHSKKENVPPTQPSNQKDLEVQLNRERQKNKLLRDEIENLKKPLLEEQEVNLEGWIKTVRGKTLQKKYAKVTENTLYLYNQPKQTIPVDSFVFKRPDCHCKYVMEPLPSEILLPHITNDELSLAIKLEVIPISQCWPPETFVFILPDQKEKSRWCSTFQILFQDSTWMQIQGDLVFKLPENWHNINCLIDLNEHTYLIGTENGLYSNHDDKLVHIESPQEIHQISIMKSINSVLMIADEKRFLLRCDLNHLINLSKYAPCSKPVLNFEKVNLKNLSGFHMLEVAKHGGKMCVATPKQLIIAEYELENKEFVPLRILDTAEPTGCALFTRNDTLIVGADKFFEIDLQTFVAEEFLDSREIDNLYKLKSFPIGIVPVGKEYLCCFNEFAVFVDGTGVCLQREIKWNQLPIVVHYSSPYLYVMQYQGLEIMKLNENDADVIKIVLPQPRFIGSNDKGVFILTKMSSAVGEIRFFDAKKLDADPSNDSTTTGTDSSDRFSFTSSVVQCLDNCSEAESESSSSYHTKRVVFTDL